MKPSLSIRGYYTILSRNQLWGLDEWRRFVDCMVEDDCNFLILWIAGGFPSRRYPETWSYNREHPNMSQDFVRELIDYAKSHGIQTVLGCSPYAYDGIASYVDAHRELAGLNQDGEIKCTPGIHDKSMWMCPQKPRSREVMLDYVREMYFDFYPNADGLFIESSDYGHCLCPACRENYTALEWEFTSAISEEVWSAKPDARIVIYPLYFQQKVAPPDPRYTLFFTPHSAHITPDVKAIDCDKSYWTMLFGEPLESVKKATALAADEGLDGYVAAMETFGITRQVGDRIYNLTPFDVPWAEPGTHPFDDLTMQMLRFACRCYSREPHMSDDAFVEAVAEHFFGDRSDTSQARDLIELVSILQMDYYLWWFRNPLVHPETFDRRFPDEKREPALQRYEAAAARLEDIRARYSTSTGNAAEMARIAGWVVNCWR